jgi:hypothetical protein
MMRYLRFCAALALFLAGAALPASACILCSGGPPFSQEIPKFPLVIFGPVVDAQLNPDGFTGSCTVRIDKVFHDSTGFLKGRKTIVIKRFTQPNPTVRYLVFFQFFDGKLDVLRSVDMNSDRIVKYMEEAPPLKPDDEAARLARLRYYFDFLMDEDKLIASDAYNEWSIAKDRDVLLVAPTLDANKLRAWLASPKAPAHCLSLFGYLLGASGTEEDADTLKRMILNPTPRVDNALDGLLAGYIHKRPDDGWKLTKQMLADGRRKWTHRLALKRMLMFFYLAKPAEVRTQVLTCLGVMLEQPDTLDIAVEQLRSWKLWDHTAAILGKFQAGAAASTISQRQIIRYAISCPLPPAKAFLQTVNPDDVKMLQADLDREPPPVNTHGK